MLGFVFTSSYLWCIVTLLLGKDYYLVFIMKLFLSFTVEC
jgi:hypothetical protein